jgi:protein O-GlcNAc transferase
MNIMKTKKLIPITIAVVIIFAGITYLTRNRIKITITKRENNDFSMAKTFTKKSPFAKGAEEHFKKGHEFLKNKRLDEALKEFQKAAEISPDTPVAHYWVGMVYFFKKEPERAIAKFKKVLDLEPENYHALAMIGKILSFDRAKLEEAIDYLKNALSINPDYADAHFDLGRIYALQGNMDRAMAEFAFIFRTEPRYAVYHFEFGRILESMKAIDRAKKEYKRALQLDPNMSRAREALERLK